MISVKPFSEFHEKCKVLLNEAINKLYPRLPVTSTPLRSPPSPEFGELSSSVCFELSDYLRMKPREMANRIVEVVDVSRSSLIKSVEAAGEGYVNFFVNLSDFSALTIESIRSLHDEYGYVKTDKPRKVIVEHTSVNPVHPIHIGQARNPILGDALSRILRYRGHTVSRHFYIDDVGRQTAVIAYGYDRLGRPKPTRKPDHFIGAIYAITNCITEIHRLKKEIEQANERSMIEEALNLQTESDDWASIASDLENRFPAIFNQLSSAIGKDENPEPLVSDLIRGYEAGEESVRGLLREVCDLSVGGFKETLERADIHFDSWDWESDHVWSGDVKRVLDRLKMTPYVFQSKGVLEFDAEKVAQDLNLKKRLNLREDYELPSLTLVRADGTTLYTTRDISYSLWKFKRAEKVINVVGMEQKLPQIQLKLALCALGHMRLANKLIHFSFNLVSLPGYRMSSRRGRYITLDEAINEAVKRAYEEVSKRSPHLPEEEKRQVSRIVGIGAVKYALIEVDPAKPVVFTWDRVLDFDRNSAPYIQYSYARGRSILRKASKESRKPSYSMLVDPLEREMILMLARFPEVFVDAAESLKPNAIADFGDVLADKFNSFYAALQVLRAEPTGLSDARLSLVEATTIVLRNILNLLGIETLERM